MRLTRKSVSIAFGALLFTFAGCGEDDFAPGEIPDQIPASERPDPVTVSFEYRALTEVREDILNNPNRRDCLTLVGRTHIHPEWLDFMIVALRPNGDMLWERTFEDVPVGRHRIRVSDPNACEENPTGAVTDQVIYANGTLLTQPADTPGTGIEPGFSFRVTATGFVAP